MGIELKERDHDLLDRFLAKALDGYRSDEITLAEARFALAHIIQRLRTTTSTKS